MKTSTATEKKQRKPYTRKSKPTVEAVVKDDGNIKAKPKKPKKKKTKDPNRLTKRQKELMSVLDTGGHAQKKKILNSEESKYQSVDKDLNPKSWVNLKTIKSLTDRSFIYKAVDGKYYSVNYHKENESKPVPATDDSLQQTPFFDRSTETPGNDNI